MRFILAFVLTILATAVPAQDATVTAQIHNAPGWLHSTLYTYNVGPPTNHKTRVNNGAAWNETNYTAGLALNNYELLDPGGGHTCTSAGSSGPSGTGSSIADGGCTWKYIGPVDYVTLTGYGLDSGKQWTTSTDYGFLDIVYTSDPGLPIYQLISAGCTSTVKPTGTVGSIIYLNGALLADSCSWTYLGQLTYTSTTAAPAQEKFFWDTIQGTVTGTTLTVTTPPATWPVDAGQKLNFIGVSPVQTNYYDPSLNIISQIDPTHWTLNTSFSGSYTGKIFLSYEGNSPLIGSEKCCIIQTSAFYVANLWNDREYVSGTNGEASPIVLYNHNYMYNDAFHDLYAPANDLWGPAGGWGFPITIQAAAGEGIADTFTANPSLALAGYNANNGVAVRGTGIGIDGYAIIDNFIQVRGIQFKTQDAYAINSMSRACNSCTFSHNILEGGHADGAVTYLPAVMNCGASCFWDNNLVVAHTPYGIFADYGARIYNNTIVCPDGVVTCFGGGTTNTIDNYGPWGMDMRGNAVFGFAHLTTANFYGFADPPTTWCGNQCATVQGTNNITDVVAGDGSTFPSEFFNGGLGGATKDFVMPFYTGARSWDGTRFLEFCGSYQGSFDGYAVPETCEATYGADPNTTFVTWPGNYKIRNTSAAYGAGASYPAYTICFGSTGVLPYCTPSPNTPDLIGTTRPQSGRYDIGVFELLGGGGVTFGGRFLFR